MTNGELVKILLPLATYEYELHKVEEIGAKLHIEISEMVPSLEVYKAILDIIGIMPENWPYGNPTDLEDAAKAAGRTEEEHRRIEKLFCRDFFWGEWYDIATKEHAPTVQDIVAFVNMLRSEVREQEKYYGTVSHGGSKDLE
jgi:hypothetical protein